MKQANNKILLKVLTTFVGVMVAVLSSSFYLLYLETQADLKVTQAQQKIVMLHAQELSAVAFHTVESDLLTLTGHQDFQQAFENNGSKSMQHLSILTQELQSFLRYKELYDQMRIIDVEGQELVRLNRSNDQIHVVAANQLQNKKDRYYFKRSNNLAPNSIFISPIDLNIEFGQIEQPIKPTIRFGLPIYDQSGKKKGILIINYLADSLLKALVGNKSHYDSTTLLVNSDGYWIKGFQPEDEWGFMYPDAEQKTIGLLFPEPWNRIHANEHGHILDNHGMFTFDTIHALKGHSSFMNMQAENISHSKMITGNYHWKVISYIANDALFAHSYDIRNKIILIDALILAIIGFILHKSYRLRLRDYLLQKEIAEKNETIREFVETSLDAIIAISQDGIITSFNPAAEKLLGYDANEAIGRNIKLIVPEPHKSIHDSYLTRYIQSGEPHIINTKRDIEAVHKNGDLIPIELCISAKKRADGWVFHGSIRDISARKALLSKLEALAITDGLTKVYNRGYFTSQIKKEFDRAKRYNQEFSLILLDIDFFKSVNDDYGHPAGDAMLIAIAENAKDVARQVDIVARYGGEEFAIILPETDEHNAMVFAERLRCKIEQTEILYQGVAIHRTASIGVASASTSRAESYHQLIQFADTALYEAKASGRNKVALWQNKASNKKSS